MIDVNNLLKTIHDNPILAGGAGLGIAGSIFASLKEAPKKVWAWVVSMTVLTATIESADEVFTWTKNYLNKHPDTPKARNVTAFVAGSLIKYFPGASRLHFFWEKKRLFWMRREVQDKPDNYGRFVEKVHFHTIGRDQKILRDFFDGVRKDWLEAPYTKTKIYLPDQGYWRLFASITPRPLDSVILDSKTKDLIKSDIKSFKENEDEYFKLNIPYRRGYLFYGPPGSGKSSIAKALAELTRSHLYILSFTDENLTDQGLLHLMSKVPNDGIVLIEDIDASFNHRDSTNTKVTFSGLLNALDGVATREGQIIIVSTNHIEKLDPALLRPGRIDLQILMDNATEAQAKELYVRFNGNNGADEFAKVHAGKSMASIQNILLEKL